MTDLSDFRREALAHSRTAESLPTMDDAGPRPGWERRAITFANGAEWAAKKLLARIAKVEALHQPYTKGTVRHGSYVLCDACGAEWPCATVRALTEGESE